MNENDYGMDACLRSVRFNVEELGEDPIRLLGKYTLRKEQDVLFNTTMISALKFYIQEKGIRWDDPEPYEEAADE